MQRVLSGSTQFKTFERSRWEALKGKRQKEKTRATSTSMNQTPSKSSCASSAMNTFYIESYIIGLPSPRAHAQMCWLLHTPERSLHNLSNVTDAEVRRLVLSAKCKSSDLDPLPTGLVKECIYVLVTPIVFTVNLSLSEGCFPDTFQVCPSLPFVEKTHTQYW